ncbi:GTP cyclohydrolase [Diplocarpon rosae]|nr:GTP cyclohydrolase [Diplocarpon rosae]
MVQFANAPSKTNDTDSGDAVKMADINSSEQEPPNGLVKANIETEGQTKKRKRKQKSEKGSKVNGSHSKRRLSVSKPARDPRDEASPARPQKETAGTRSPSPAEARLQKLAGAVRTILECLGEDPDREGLLGTPERYAKAMLFFTKGYQENVKDIVNDAIFHEGHNELVIVKDIEVFSLCEHHMVPFTGKMHIGYIPDRDVIGISKLPRIADMFSRRLQIQERLTKDVAHAVMEILKPQGVAVVMESSHLCMVMRGVEKTSATTITSCVLGCIEKREKTRNEFFSLVGLNRR